MIDFDSNSEYDGPTRGVGVPKIFQTGIIVMWQLESTAEYDRRYAYFEKKHPDELEAVLDNLDTYLTALNMGAKPQQVKYGFIHPEPNGVIAIDQSKHKGKLKQTRLYVYPDTERQILNQITIGDKNSQRQGDLATCREFIKHYRKDRRI